MRSLSLAVPMFLMPSAIGSSGPRLAAGQEESTRRAGRAAPDPARRSDHSRRNVSVSQPGGERDPPVANLIASQLRASARDDAGSAAGSRASMIPSRGAYFLGRPRHQGRPPGRAASRAGHRRWPGCARTTRRYVRKRPPASGRCLGCTVATARANAAVPHRLRPIHAGARRGGEK